MNYLELFKLVVPETIMVVGALGALLCDLLMRDLELPFRRLIGAMIASVACVAAIAWMLVMPEQAKFMDGILVVDSLIRIVKVSILILTILTLLLSVETSFTKHVGEYFAILLLAAIGMLFLVSSEDILMIFISLELTSLSLYILTAFNKRNVKSAEAALKYFLFGGMSAAFTLFGLSLLYGLAGSTNLGQIAAAAKVTKLDSLLVVSIVMTVIGFGFKIAAVPFHLWAPDAYEGAPTPSAAFIASGSKVASIFIFAKVLLIGFAGAEGSGSWHQYAPGWVPVLALVAVASMLLGNLAAIAQSSVRRLLAYSAIAHAGYMLLALLSHGPASATYSSIIFYVVTYGLTTLGAFGVVSVVQEKTGGDKLSDFAGLSRRAPVLSFCMLIFMLSLAGIPPLAGFFGKFFVFTSALNGPSGLGLLWLVIAAIALSAVSLYYYLQVLKQIYIAQPTPGITAFEAPVFSQVVLSLVAAAVLILGCFPDLLLGSLGTAIQVAGF